MDNVILDIVRLVQGPLAEAAPKSGGPGGFDTQLARAVNRLAGEAEPTGPASRDNGSAAEATGQPAIADSPGGASPEPNSPATGQTVTPSGTDDQNAGGIAVSGLGNITAPEVSALSALDPALASLLDSIYGEGEPSLVAISLGQIVGTAIGANVNGQPLGHLLTLGDANASLTATPVTGTGEGQSAFVTSTIPALAGVGSAADASGQPAGIFAAAVNAALTSLGNGGPNELTRQPVSVPRNGPVFPLPATSQIIPVAAGSTANAAFTNFTIIAASDPDAALLPRDAADAFRASAISIFGRALPAAIDGPVTPGLAALATSDATPGASNTATPTGAGTSGSLLSGTALNTLFNSGEFSGDAGAVLNGPANAGTPAVSAGAAPAVLPATVVAETAGTTATPQGHATANTSSAPESTLHFRPVTGQLAIHLAQAIQKGVSRFSVRLHPAELGRVDVRMDVAHDGRVTAIVSAERQETLDLLKKDSGHLERSLQDSGLKADSNSLSFSLRDRAEGHARFEADGGSEPALEGGNTGDDVAQHENTALAAAQIGANAGAGRLNILV